MAVVLWTIRAFVRLRWIKRAIIEEQEIISSRSKSILN
jgi:hypothetical protein